MYENLLNRLTDLCRSLFAERLTGVYLHGSAAMGCFHPEKSDLDIIIVVKDSLEASVKMDFMQELVRLNQAAPAKGIELSIVKREHLNPFAYPTPFELHFSVMHLNWFQQNPEDYVQRMQGVDRDLAAHCTILRKYGIVLFGEPIDAVFGPVGREEYIDSIWLDVRDAREDIVKNSLYVTLNLCRVLAYLRDGLVLSKKAGGEWGLHSLPPRFHGCIREALACYAGQNEMTGDAQTLACLADYALEKIESLRQASPLNDGSSARNA